LQAATFATGLKPDGLVASDLLSNGKTDLVVANQGASSVSVLLGNGNGTFQAATSLATEPYPAALAVADLNGDGFPDIVAACQGSVSVLLGNGDGTFKPAVDYSVGYHNSLAIADVNGDGKPDIVVAYNHGAVGGVQVLLGNGNGTFHAASPSPGNPSYSVAVGAIYGDNIPDIITGDTGTTVSVRRGNGDGTFQAPTTLTTAGAGFVALADLTGAGVLDLVTASSSSSGAVSVFLGNGNGTFQTPTSYTALVPVNSFAVADVNGDGKPDIITANSLGNEVAVFLGNGNGTFLAPSTVAANLTPVALAVADVNGDLSPDVVVANYSLNQVSVLLNNSAPQTGFQVQQIPGVGTALGGHTIQAGDLIGNGIPDLVVGDSSPGMVSVLLGNGNGTFQAPTSYMLLSSSSYPSSVLLADLTGDGKLDIITDDASGSINVLMGNGNGTFQAATSFSAGAGSYCLAIADLNGDNIPDLIQANRSPGTGLKVLIGNGNGTFQAPTNISGIQAQTLNSLAVADLTGNGINDLVVAQEAQDTVWVLLGNGNGTFQAATSFTSNLNGQGPDSVVVADINGDNKPDILTGNLTGSVSVLLGNGNGTFQTGTTYPGVPMPAIAVADMNADGKPDVIAAGSTVIGMLFGNGNGSFQAPLEVPNLPTIDTFAAADLNGDNRPDLVLGNAATGIEVLLNVSNAATHLSVIAPTTATAGTIIPITVTALNSSGLESSGYTGTVAFNSTDPQFSLPSYTFTANDQGVHTFNVILKTSGTESITASDTNNSGVTGVSNYIVVTPAAAHELLFEQQPTDTFAGQMITPAVTVEIADAFGNLIPTDSSQVTLALVNNPGGSTLSGATQVGAVNGIATFSTLTLNKSGLGYTLTATDSTLVSATSAGFNITPAAAASLGLTAPSSTPVDQGFSLTVTAEDQFGNVATSYRGTVHFFSSDSGPVLPNDYMFGVGDQGIHTFSLTLRSAGSETVTVQDLSNSFTQDVTVTVTTTDLGIRTWTGNAGTNSWSNAANWLEGLIPQTNDSLVFPDAIISNPTNDLSSFLTLNSISFTGNSGGYDVAGNAIELSSGIAGNGGGADKIDIAAITLNGLQAFAAGNFTLVISSPIALNGSTLMLDGSQVGNALDGIISGTGTLIKNDTGDWQLGSANTFTGSTTINAGTLTLFNSTSLGTGTGTNPNSATVNSSGSLQIGLGLIISQALTINGTGNTFSAGAINILPNNAAGTVSLGSLTLASPSELSSGPGMATVVLNGPIQNNGQDLTIQGVYDTALIGTVSGSGVIQDSGTIFSGTGTVTGALYINQGTLSPGFSQPGILNTGTVAFNQGTTFQVDLSGGKASSPGYSQLVATGPVDLTRSPTLNVTTSNGFTVSPNQVFTIVQSTSTITGVFRDSSGNPLPDGSTIVFMGVTCLVEYEPTRVLLIATPAATITTLSPLAITPIANQPVTLTATVAINLSLCCSAASPPLGKEAAVPGTVLFEDNGISLGSSTLSGGVATLSVTLSVGTHPITATFLPNDTVYAQSPPSAILNVVVGTGSTMTNPFYVAEIPGQGIWRYSGASATGTQLLSYDAVQVGVDDSGDVIAQFTGHGVWLYTDAASWQQLSPVDAAKVAIDGAGQVLAQFNGNGLWMYTVATNWQRLSPADAASIAINDQGEVTAQFNGYGVWRFELTTGFQKLLSVDAAQVAIDDNGDVTAQFNGNGLWMYTDATSWQRLSSADASWIGADGNGTVVAQFNGNGVWRMEMGSFQQILSVDATQVAIDAQGDVIAAFTGFGFWRYTDATLWQRLSTADANSISVDL
jgi:autotransporter-associated beta strand protein